MAASRLGAASDRRGTQSWQGSKRNEAALPASCRAQRSRPPSCLPGCSAPSRTMPQRQRPPARPPWLADRVRDDCSAPVMHPTVMAAASVQCLQRCRACNVQTPAGDACLENEQEGLEETGLRGKVGERGIQSATLAVWCLLQGSAHTSQSEFALDGRCTQPADIARGSDGRVYRGWSGETGATKQSPKLPSTAFGRDRKGSAGQRAPSVGAKEKARAEGFAARAKAGHGMAQARPLCVSRSDERCTMVWCQHGNGEERVGPSRLCQQARNNTRFFGG